LGRRPEQTKPPCDWPSLTLACQHGRLTVRDAERLTGANRNTLKAHFRKLAALQVLAQDGRGRGLGTG